MSDHLWRTEIPDDLYTRRLAAGRPVSNRERRKGLEGEREVANLLRRYGWQVEPLGGRAGQSDLLAKAGKLTLLLDSKRQERLQLWGWVAQMGENPNLGLADLWAIPFRRSRSDWLAIVRFEDLVRFLP